MAQVAVEQCIGRLLTDEAARARFSRDPDGTLRDIAREARMTITPAACAALRATALDHWQRMADAIDARLQRLADLVEDQ